MKLKRTKNCNLFPKLLVASASIFALTTICSPSLAEDSEKTKDKAKTVKNVIEGCKTNAAISQLIVRPESWIGKEVCIKGKFSSFSALALDYPPALRERKNYISLTLFRPKTTIPLGELKIAMKIKEAQNHEVLPKISEGDEVEIKGKVFSAALGEPWMDVLQIKVHKDPNAKDDDDEVDFNAQ